MEETEVRKRFIDGGNISEDEFYRRRKQSEDVFY